MFLALVIWSTVVVATANPLHKYPYVFLLDVGNEELEKTNTEQLRVSVPGGSLAVKYPAMGEGDPISHVRVSGIDFGTDLRVNIVDGGPGYKYVVLMFMGNPGVTYDAVVTLETQQTIPRGTEINLTANNKMSTTENFIGHPYEVSEADSVDNDQDLINKLKDMKQYTKKSKEVVQSSSMFYNYAKKEIPDVDEDDETDNVSSEEEDDSSDNDDVNEDEKDEFLTNKNQRFPNEEKFETSYEDEDEVENKDNENEQDDNDQDDNDQDDNERDINVKSKFYSQPNTAPNIPRAEQYRYNVNLNNEDNAKSDNMYNKYQDLKPHYGLGYRVYPQSFIYNRKNEENSVYNKEESPELGQMSNNEKVSNYNRFKDGSNSIDPDYLVAEY